MYKIFVTNIKGMVFRLVKPVNFKTMTALVDSFEYDDNVARVDIVCLGVVV